jgi:hypothetical protein
LTDFNKKISELTEKIGLDLDKSIGEIVSLKDKPAVKKTVEGTKRVGDYINENLTIFIGGIVCILIVLVIAVIIAINYRDIKTRVVTITEIGGAVMLEADSRNIPASKNGKLSPGDIITTGEDAKVRLRLDPDKTLSIESNSSVKLDFSQIEGMGSITVTLLYGSVITEMENEIGKNDSFTVLTPNASVSARKSVFRTVFTYYDDYGGSPAKITDIENFAGNLTLQLFDDNTEKTNNPMIQGPRTLSKLITTPTSAMFAGINDELNLLSIPMVSLTEILRISNNTPLDYTTFEINDALRALSAEHYATLPSVTLPEVTAATPFEPVIPPPITSPPSDEITAVYSETTVSETEPEPLATTQTLASGSSYTGIRWWEITNTLSAPNDPASTTLPPDTSEISE